MPRRSRPSRRTRRRSRRRTSRGPPDEQEESWWKPKFKTPQSQQLSDKFEQVRLDEMKRREKVAEIAYLEYEKHEQDRIDRIAIQRKEREEKRRREQDKLNELNRSTQRMAWEHEHRSRQRGGSPSLDDGQWNRKSGRLMRRTSKQFQPSHASRSVPRFINKEDHSSLYDYVSALEGPL